MSTNNMLSIKDVCEEYNLSPVYVRRMILKKKIKTTKQPMNDGKQYKHMIARSEVERWRKQTSAHTMRTDGRNKYNIYCTKSEFTKLQKLLQDNNLKTPLVRANPPKK